jgi:hypothetical protein
MFQTFDFANPDMTTGERQLTTVPQQALFMMNSPFVVEQVKSLLARADFPTNATDEDKVRFVFRTVFQRPPSATELRLAVEFLAGDAPEPSTEAVPAPTEDPADAKARARKLIAAKAAQPSKQLSQWERYTQVVLQTNELIFVR